MSAFISKPSGGWVHSEELISTQGATYAIRVTLYFKLNLMSYKNMHHFSILDV